MGALVSYIIGSLFTNVKTYTRHVVMLAIARDQHQITQWYKARITNLRESSLALNSCTLSLCVFFAVCFALSSRCEYQLHPISSDRQSQNDTHSSLLSLQESPLRFRHLRSIFSPLRSRRRGPNFCAHFPLSGLILHLLVLLLDFIVDFGAVRRRVRFLLLLPVRK